MNRRKFLGNTAMAAALVSIAPGTVAGDLACKTKNTLIFVFRGVSFSDAEIAIHKANILGENTLLQKVICNNTAYTHTKGITDITQPLIPNTFYTIQTQSLERYKISEIINVMLTTKDNKTRVIQLHHTEIGHSSNKLYQESLLEFFTELKKVYDPKKHKIIVTADIGRNEKLNSCGGKDHSNETCLETFVLFMGGSSSKLKLTSTPLTQQEILQQKF